MILSARFQGIAAFGTSGSAIAQLADREIVTTPNRWRAEALVGMIESGQAIVRRTFQTRAGTEVYALPNPKFIAVLRHRYAYPGDVRATLIALAEQLGNRPGLRDLAEQIGITGETITDWIESADAEEREQRQWRKGFDA